jgi:hypothetical protein
MDDFKDLVQDNLAAVDEAYEVDLRNRAAKGVGDYFNLLLDTGTSEEEARKRVDALVDMVIREKLGI